MTPLKRKKRNFLLDKAIMLCYVRKKIKENYDHEW